MFAELSTRPDEYRRDFPSFGRPRIVGYLSLDGERRLHHDTSRLKFARRAAAASVRYDLNRGLQRAVRRSEEHRDERISHLLQFLLGQERRLLSILREDEPSLEKARFFCYRGLLTLIANTPYENRDAWRVVATLHRGAIYLCQLDTEESLRRKRQMSERELQFTSWGYKFEQYILSDEPGSEPDASAPVDESEEFSLVFTTHLGRHRLLYAAEMDGVRCDAAPPPPPPPPADSHPDAVVDYLAAQRFVELKTNRHIEFPRQETNFRRFKARKWWCQSFLAGVEDILCGFRNDDGIVEELKVYSVKDIPKTCKPLWDPNVCFNFLDTFLTYAKRCLARELKRRGAPDAPVALHFEWAPRAPVRVTDAYDPQAEPVLPAWFLDNYGDFLDTFLMYVKQDEALSRPGRPVALHFELAPRVHVRVIDAYDPQAESVLPTWILDNYVCDFLDTFLTYVKRNEAAPRSDAPITLHIEWVPRAPVRVTDAYDPQAEPVLPAWFLDNYDKHGHLEAVEIAPVANASR